MRKLLGLILFLGMFLVGCSNSVPKENVVPNNTAQEMQSEGQQEDAAQSENAQDEDEEPYIVSFTAKTIGGQDFSSDQFGDSKITMINVWATYCNPCLMEMPDLGDIAESYDKVNFQLIGVISDVTEESPGDDITNAKELIRQTEAEYPHLLLNQSLYDNLVGGVSSVPTTFFVNSKGEMLGYVVGANDEDTWERIIDELLIKEGVSVDDDKDGDD